MVPPSEGESALRLIDRVPRGAFYSPDEVLDRFLGWVADQHGVVEISGGIGTWPRLAGCAV